MNDLIVFFVGFMVSMLVVYGIFSRVAVEMRDAREQTGSGISQNQGR